MFSPYTPHCTLTYDSLGVMITTGFEEIEKAFNVTADQVSFNLTGLLQMTTGSGTFFTAAAAAVWGKRPVFLISTLFLLATNAWGFFAGVSLLPRTICALLTLTRASCPSQS